MRTRPLAVQSRKPLMRNIFYGHLACWAVFIAYEMASVIWIVHRTQPPFNYVVYYAINIGFFYTVLWATSERFRSRALISVLLIAVALNVFFLLKVCADALLLSGPWPKRWAYARAWIPADLNRAVFFGMLAAFYRVATAMGRFRRKAAEARIIYLGQALQPHLLFNTLNFVYAHVEEHSAEAADCVALLSEVLRFGMMPAGPDSLVVLADEVAQLRHLVAINRYRFGGTFCLELSLPEVPERARVLPLVLLTLTENVFKHGELQNEREPALIFLSVAFGRLLFRTVNRKRHGTAPGASMGLAHVRLRLDHYYGRNYELVVRESTEDFTLELSLPV